MSQKDIIDLIISVLTFFTTIFIAVVLQRYSIKSFTFSALNTLRDNIKELDYELSRKFGTDPLTMKDIEDADRQDGNKTSWEIKCLLNEYEQLASGVNYKLLSEKISKISRMNTIVHTYYHYSFFIENWRKTRNRPHAWEQLEILAKKWKNEN